MTFTSVQAKSLAGARKRDEHGHFIKGSGIKTKVSVNSPKDVPINPEFEKPLLQVSVTNPFKKILYWLDQIRRRQTTTFAFKLSIPLIALPIVILGVFSLGRFYGISLEKSKLTASPVPSPNTQYQIQNTVISKAGTLKIAKSASLTRYLLSLKNGELLNLQIPPNIDLTKYQNKQILVTGTYDKNTQVLTVTDISEVEVFNTTIISTPTPSPSPIATPAQSTSSVN